MKDRIAEFLKEEGLTPSKLAEMLGVQPSSISHLLSGRNKPGFDFIVKFLQRFPKVNPDWLILGKGKIYRESDTRQSLFSNIEPLLPNQFPPEEEPNQKTQSSEKRIFQGEPIDITQDQDPVTTNSNKSNNGTIEQLIICYDDHTFATYIPRK